VRYRLKTPYRDCATHLVLEPLGFLARLAALVSPPRVHPTAITAHSPAHAGLRGAFTPARRGQGAKDNDAANEPSLVAKHVRMTWAQRLKRVFAIDIERCRRCGG
jgi:Putative transposase